MTKADGTFIFRTEFETVRVCQIMLCFDKGICILINGEVPVRGRVDPNSTVGNRFLRKNSQKLNDDNNAEIMNCR